MTLSNVSSSILSISVDKTVNGEKWTLASFTKYLRNFFEHLELERFCVEVALPDGWWWCEITRKGNEYSYWIPETREQEKKAFPAALLNEQAC